VWRQGDICGLKDATDHAFDVGAGDDAIAEQVDISSARPMQNSQITHSALTCLNPTG